MHLIHNQRETRLGRDISQSAQVLGPDDCVRRCNDKGGSVLLVDKPLLKNAWSPPSGFVSRHQEKPRPWEYLPHLCGPLVLQHMGWDTDQNRVAISDIGPDGM